MVFDKNKFDKKFSISALRAIIRELNGGNVAEFARFADINRTTIAAWLSGISTPKLNNFSKLLAYTGKPEEYFFCLPTEYETIPEHLHAPGQGEMRPGSYGMPDLDEHSVSKIHHELTGPEYHLIMALRELDNISREGIYLAIMIELNKAMREKGISKNKRKLNLLRLAIDKLKKAK